MVDEYTASSAAPPRPDLPSKEIRFDVSYELREYLSFVREGLLQHLIRQARDSGKPPLDRVPWLVSLLMTPVAAVAFFVKSRLVGACEFTIDRATIVRRSARGTAILRWTDVVAIDRCSRGYLVHKRGGGMPLPHRCLTSDQRTMLDVLVAERERALVDSRTAADPWSGTAAGQ